MKRFCTSCGNELVADTAFCDNCGTPIKKVAVAESTGTSRLLDARVDANTEPRSGRGRRPLLIAGAATIAAAIAIGGVWWATAKKSSEIATKSDGSGSVLDTLGSAFFAGSSGSGFVGKWKGICGPLGCEEFEIRKTRNSYIIEYSYGSKVPSTLSQDGTLQTPEGKWAIDAKSDTLLTPRGEFKRVNQATILTEVDMKNVRSLAGEFDGVRAAVFGYLDRFKALPGDDIAAAAHVAGATNATTPTGKQGNGVIDGLWNSSLPTDESFLLWQHLVLAGYIASKYPPENILGGRIGITSTTTATSSPITGLHGVKGYLIVCSDGIPGKLAKELDRTIDDGSTTTGAMMVGPAGLTTGATAIPSTTAGFNDTLYTVCMKR